MRLHVVLLLHALFSCLAVPLFFQFLALPFLHPAAFKCFYSCYIELGVCKVELSERRRGLLLLYQVCLFEKFLVCRWCYELFGFFFGLYMLSCCLVRIIFELSRMYYKFLFNLLWLYCSCIYKVSSSCTPEMIMLEYARLTSQYLLLYLLISSLDAVVGKERCCFHR